MIKVDIILGSQSARGTRPLDICVLIMLECQLGYEFKGDTKELMKLTRGSVSPVHGFAMVAPDGRYIGTNYFDLVKWIELEGLRPL